MRVGSSTCGDLTTLFNIYHCHDFFHALDDLEASVDAGSFGEGFREGVVPPMAVDYQEYIFLQ